MKYVIGYRCSLCGQLVIPTKNNYECSHQEGKTLLSKMVSFGNTFSGSQFQDMYPLQTIHNCNDGSIGIANLVGLISYTPEEELN